MPAKEEQLRQAKSFEALLIEAVDEGLMSLGESCRAVIYFHIEKNNSIRKDEIPRRIKEFSSAIHQLFGVGGEVIEKLILKTLCELIIATKWEPTLDYEKVKNKEFHVVVEEIMKTPTHLM